MSDAAKVVFTTVSPGSSEIARKAIVRIRRRLSNTDQGELARALGISPATMSRTLKNMDRCVQVQAALGFNPASLVSRKTYPPDWIKSIVCLAKVGINVEPPEPIDDDDDAE